MKSEIKDGHLVLYIPLVKETPEFVLTRSEARLLPLLLTGKSMKELAKMTGLKQRTVKAYTSKILEKSGSPSRLVLMAKILMREK